MATAEITRNVNTTNGTGFIVRAYHNGSLLRAVEFGNYDNARQWAIDKGYEIAYDIVMAEQAKKAYTAKQVEGGRWKFGVPSKLRGNGYSSDYWTWSPRSYASKAGALRAARNYLNSYQAMHNRNR